MMFDYQIFQKSICSTEEKNRCINLVDQLYEFSVKARNEGILSLEEDIPYVKNDFLREALKLVIDGIDPEIAAGILYNLISGGDLEGSELLELMIVTEGVLRIQQGVNPNLLKKILLSLLGARKYLELNRQEGEPKETFDGGVPDLEAETGDETLI